jgi:membrane-bound metal-dependent hydrolase YbcI (DUF457 family)
VSWAAHDFETYVLQRHLGVKVSFLAIVVGTYFPDAFTKWWVYGVNKGPIKFGAEDPVRFHRGWPGAGFTHSIVFIIVVAVLFYTFTKSRAWGWGVLAGGLAHIITDTSDTVGTLLFWPFFNENISTGLWAYAAEAGRYDDAAAYYSSLGFVMDAFWLVVALAYFSVFREKYFWSVIVPADPRIWAKLRERAPDRVLVALYRAGMFYGMTRLIFWTVWTHIYQGASAIYDGWDLTPGGPDWIPSISL